MPLTVLDKIKIAKISQYLSLNDVGKGSLFGQRLDPELPQKLYMERTAVEWEYNNEPITAGQMAEGTIVVDDIGNPGDEYIFTYNYPGIGVVVLGNYITQNTDTTTTILAASIASALGNNSYGFTFVASGNEITYDAPVSLGASANGTAIYCTYTAAKMVLTTIATQSVSAPPSSGDNVMYILKVDNNTTSSKSITNIKSYVRGTHSTGDFFSLDIYANTSATLSGASYLNSAAPIDSNTTLYDISVSDTISAAATKYYILVLSVNATPTAGRTGFINGLTDPVQIVISGGAGQDNQQSNLSGIVTIS